MEGIQYTAATRTDLQTIQSLLIDCHLATDGSEHWIDNCFCAKADSKVVGVIAIELFGNSGLLRSLAVESAYRGRSLGHNLTSRLLSHARLKGVEHVYLLTTNAEQYFTSLGFRLIPRSDAPAQIQATEQFRSLCPTTASCMLRNVVNEPIA